MTANPEHFSSEQLFQSKEERRRKLATEMTFEEKLQAVVKLQYLAAAMGRSAGRKVQKPWSIRINE